LLSVLVLSLFLPVRSLAADAGLEEEVQGALRRSQETVAAMAAMARDGAVDAELRGLRELADEVRATHLLLLERHRLRQEEAEALGGAAAARQQEAQAHYRAAVEHFLALVDSLADPLDPAVLQRLQTLLERLLPRRQQPLLGALPYRHLNLSPLTPATAPAVVPAYLGGDPTVAPADTEGPHDPEIARLAESLGWSPVAIYEWFLKTLSASGTSAR
jgi:hypothetical protein